MAVTTTPQTGGEAPKAAVAEPRKVGGGLLDPKILWKSLPDAFKKLDPRVQIKNPVMFVVEVGAAITTYTAITGPASDAVFNWTIVVWLWLTNRGPQYGWGWLMAALLIFSGTQLVMLGLIGGALRRHLEDKYELSALNRRPIPGVNSHQGDIADLDALESLPP